MPNTFTTSFASAAAGATSDNVARRDGSGNDWTRSRVNGTQTFRRPSTQSRDNLQATTTSSTAPYIPPHLNTQAVSSRNGVAIDSRYSRDDLLSIYKNVQNTGSLDMEVDRYFVGPWDRHSELSDRVDVKDAGAEVCWNPRPVNVPLCLQPMDEAEERLFSTSVNSPLKMNNSKEGQSTGAANRKTSLSMVNTTGNSRPGTRRRETSDSYTNNGPLSPTTEKIFRNETTANTPPAALLRRRTDYQDEPQERDEPRLAENNSPFASLRRIGTGGPPSAGFNPPSASPWSSGPQSGFGAMGAFSGLSSDQHSGYDVPAQRPVLGSTRSQSRFAHTFKTSEDMSPAIKEKPSFTGLEKLPEEEDAAQSRVREQIKNRPNRSETNPYSDAMPDRTGSAALSAHDESGVMEQMGFNPLQSAQTPHHRFNQDPASPTNTNPWQSPQGGRVPDEDMHDGLSGGQHQGRRDVFAGDHRVQNSFGSLRGSGSVGGLGGLGGWQNPGFGTGTPGRERPAVSAAFGDPVFSPIGGLQSPGGFGGGSFFGGPYNNRQTSMALGLPFPSAMQDQMRSDSRNEHFAARHDPFDVPRQEPFRTPFDEMKRPIDENYGPPASHSPAGPPATSGSGGAHDSAHDGSGSSSPSQIPTAQQRQMVMPDRMRWVYRDPHGNVQGPWSGLEMHDWFKAGFFTAELQVKKVEDTEYEPLAQLVRRIGNSREPFLVPQIGVPHGPEPIIAPGPAWSGTPTGAAQPPFASAFPSFGTTLTAAQQNALERRKQEEQFLMARQKEFLNQRQLGMHNTHGQHSTHIHSLQHHSSAHSLHSQPSFGSITSPTAYQQSPMPAPVGQQSYNAGLSNMTPTSTGPPGSRDEDLQSQFNRMSMESRGPYGNNSLNQQSFAAHERNRLSMEQQQAQQFAHETAFLGHQGRNDRLEEFNELRQDMDEAELDDDHVMPAPIGTQRTSDELAALKQLPTPIGAPIKKHSLEDNEPLSLTQQVQRTAAANRQAADEKPVIEIPPVSISPLPAPAAQRSRQQTVAEQLAAGSRSAAQTPAETPSVSLAPWADKTSEVAKGPSLKQIQEAEAKRAAEQEAITLEARRVQMEQERVAATQIIPPAPGLPLTSTWANSGSPSTPTTPGGSVWSKSSATTKVPSVASTKKTLAQIQKEEEARKQRAAAQAAANAPPSAYTNAALPAGSRYAQMASKPSVGQGTGAVAPTTGQPMIGGAWTTVGASGKPKTPATVVASPTLQRAVTASASNVANRPIPNAIRSVSITGVNKTHARDELIKWTKLSMAKGLNSGTNVDNFVSTLLELPQEVEIVADAIYAMSDTLDGRRFAEEFLRRRKLADKGVVDTESKTVTSADDKTSNGGWSEVAKKGPITASQQKEDSASATGFKVVSKKKGKR